jgi:hypothetical protein
MASPPAHIERLRQDLFIEPLGGPAHMEALLSHFPDSIYDKSPSSHFYKFVYSLLGPSGVGQLVRNYFQARLLFLEYNVELFDIERFYGDPFKFGRIFEEQSFADVDQSLLPENWEQIKAKDASYRSRALDFMGAVRFGSSPQGMALAAKSGLGAEVEIIERYQWLFDQASDQPIGVKSFGKTLSTNEFTVVPRRTDGEIEVQQIKFQATTVAGEYVLSFLGHQTEPISHQANSNDVQNSLSKLLSIGEDGVVVTGGPLPFPFTVRFVGNLANEDLPLLKINASTLRDENDNATNAQIVVVNEGIRPIDTFAKIPERLAHNVQSALDRLRPVNSFFSFEKAQGFVVSSPFDAFASSYYKEPIRFVTGNLGVKWPQTEPEKYWITPGVEKAAKRIYQSDSAHYVNFHVINSVGVQNLSVTDSRLMIDPNPDSRSIVQGQVQGQVQGMYPPEYASLSGVTNAPLSTYWESSEASYSTNEVIEIDLGTSKPTNFLFFDVNAVPVKVHLEYCVWENGGVKEFAPVVPTDPSYSGFIDEYNAQKWRSISCQFEDETSRIPITRFIRITLERLETDNDFSIRVRNLKAGRNIML